MRALLIDPEQRSITEVTVNNKTELCALLGCDEIRCDTWIEDYDDDHVYINKHQTSVDPGHWFQIGRAEPIEGLALVLGRHAGSRFDPDPKDSARISLAELKSRVMFASRDWLGLHKYRNAPPMHRDDEVADQVEAILLECARQALKETGGDIHKATWHLVDNGLIPDPDIAQNIVKEAVRNLRDAKDIEQ